MRARLGPMAVGATLVAAVACGSRPDTNSVFEQIAEARRRTAELLVTFTKASEAANRAVMSVADQPAREAAAEARGEFADVRAEVDALRVVLEGLGYTTEAEILAQFTGQFTAYHTLVENILELSVENTNERARRLSFDEAQQEADEAARAVLDVAPRSPADEFRVKWLAATAVASLREIQALEAPHIAEPTDAVMDTLEQRMATAEQSTRAAMRDLGPRVAPASTSRLKAAVAAFDRFMQVHARIIGFSRRNSDVRSLALALEEKPKLLAPCEESLRALQAALAERHRGRG